jgi:hypothetical protein
VDEDNLHVDYPRYHCRNVLHLCGRRVLSSLPKLLRNAVLALEDEGVEALADTEHIQAQLNGQTWDLHQLRRCGLFFL